ncbi:MAG TPA: kelch repeat-containing protein [Polyangiales bacterium]|nr:kelch repeat-containing protein [Polyangiales bacterium]
MCASRVLISIAACLATACVPACAPEPQVTTAALRLRALQSCPVAGAQRLRLTLDGDFPSEQHELAAGQPFALDSAPLQTQWLGVSGELAGQSVAGAIARGRAEQGAGVILLPQDEICPLGDPLAAGFAGAAIAALPEGDLLIAGGRLDSGASTAAAALLPAGEPLARAVEGGMLLRRAGASATAFAGGVLIAGGAPDDDGPAQDTFEIYDPGRARFDPPQKLAGGQRRDHGAISLPDGRVLLVGGRRTLAGESLASAELFDPVLRRTQSARGDLAHPRALPQVLVLDDGSVLVALGRGADGSAETAVERFDRERERFETVAAVLPAHADQAVAALEGRRVAYVGCSPEDGCQFGLLLPDGDDFVWHERVLAAPVALSEVRLVALRDGQVLLTGRELASGAGPRAYLIDLAYEQAAEAPAVAAPNALRVLADGVVVELDPFGASLRRHDLASPWHDPPDPVIGDGAVHVALDVGSRWQARSGLRALEPARFDLPASRFGAVRVELALTGGAALLLEPEGEPPIAIALRDDQLRIVGEACQLARADAAPLVIERAGSAVTLSTGSASRRCELPRLAGASVGVALEADEGARVQRLRVLRR